MRRLKLEIARGLMITAYLMVELGFMLLPPEYRVLRNQLRKQMRQTHSPKLREMRPDLH